MVYIAGDHLAIELIRQLEDYFQKRGIAHENLGARSSAETVRLQKIIPAVAQKVQKESSATGILACGTGAGVEIGANRFRGIRASLCRDAEQARNARIYDNANILCLGSWYQNDALAILDAWFGNTFDGDADRTQMLRDFDTWQ
jgi:ribose 5-phosphate isomerase B